MANEMLFRDALKHIAAAGKGSQEARASLKTTGYLEEGQGSMGGFTVPQQVHDAIMGVALERSIVRSRATVIPMETETITISRIVDTSHASNVLGGITVYKTNEGAALSESNPALGALTLTARKQTGLCYTSNEWLADTAIAGEALLTQAFGEAIAYFLDDLFINGSGVNEPLGILNSGALLTPSLAAAALAWADLVTMHSRLLEMSDPYAVWLINKDLEPLLYGTTPGSGWVDEGKIFNKPVIPTDKCQTVGTRGDIILADFTRYVIGEMRLMVASSGHFAFSTDTTAWKFVLRTDGQPIPVSPTTPKYGANTLSPFIALDIGASSSSSSSSFSSSSSSSSSFSSSSSSFSSSSFSSSSSSFSSSSFSSSSASSSSASSSSSST